MQGLMAGEASGSAVRVATPADADAIAAIHAPIVATTSISFELDPPSVDERRERIVATLAHLPWLVSEDGQGNVDGYVYASRHRERAAGARASGSTPGCSSG